MVCKSLNTHGTLSVYLFYILLIVSCLKQNRFGEIVNSGSQSNSKVQSTLSRCNGSDIYFTFVLLYFTITVLFLSLHYHKVCVIYYIVVL